MGGIARGEGFEERGWDRWVKSAVSREDCCDRLSSSA
jgi:predicted secreted acid phosphatase